MKTLFKLPFLSLLSLSLFSFNLFAINAPTGIISARQPDGTSVDVRFDGNEEIHYTFSSDGYLLTTDEEGFYMFADISPEGEIIPTEFRACNPDQRPASLNAMLAKTDTERMISILYEAHTRRTLLARQNKGLMTTYYPTTGNPKALVILVEFSDMDFSVDNPNDFYNRMLNQKGFSENGATGCAKEYYVENSEGLFDPEFDVYGPVKLTKTVGYYGSNDGWGNDRHPWEMVIEACEFLDKEIDFSQYDCNGDGVIDNVFVYYAGYGEADGGGASTIWPHSTNMSLIDRNPHMFDGVRLDRYACSNELQTFLRKDFPDGIGTFCHEFCHVMGLPDLYATSGFNFTTPGDWDLMDHGSYNNYCLTPPNLSSYERYALGWLTPTPLGFGDYTLAPLHEKNVALIYTSKNEDEYYLFENRQQEGNDKFLPWHGMLVWHINYKPYYWENNIVNNSVFQNLVDLVEADNVTGDGSRRGDPFPGTSLKTEFTRFTRPAFEWSSYELISIGLYDIHESEDGMISFMVTEATMPNGIEAPINEDSYKIEGNQIVNYDGTLLIYGINGMKIAEIEQNSSLELPSGFYIAVKGGIHKKFSI